MTRPEMLMKFNDVMAKKGTEPSKSWKLPDSTLFRDSHSLPLRSDGITRLTHSSNSKQPKSNTSISHKPVLNNVPESHLQHIGISIQLRNRPTQKQ
jgi:hypothetical protein